MKKLLMSVAEVCEATGLSRTTIWNIGNEDSTFPRPIKVGRRALYDPTEVEAWVAKRLAARAA